MNKNELQKQMDKLTAEAFSNLSARWNRGETITLSEMSKMMDNFIDEKHLKARLLNCLSDPHFSTGERIIHYCPREYFSTFGIKITCKRVKKTFANIDNPTETLTIEKKEMLCTRF